MRKADILDRIVTWYGLKNKTELARFLGVTPQTISNWYSRDSIDYDLIFGRCAGVDLNWLILGKTSYIVNNKTSDLAVASDVVGTYGCTCSEPSVEGACTVSVDIDGSIYPISVPDRLLSNGPYRIYRVTDDAMVPNFQRGNYVLCRLVPNLTAKDTETDKLYVVVLKDGHAALRRLREEAHATSTFVLTADRNDPSRYPDITASVSEIESAWQVKWTISRYEEEFPDLYRRLQDMERGMADIRRAVSVGWSGQKR